MRILADEDSQDKNLVSLLKSEGHDVHTVNDYSLAGADDIIVFQCAAGEDRAILTRNVEDFQEIHAQDSGHSGILLHYCENNQFQLTHKSIARAIANIERDIGEIAGQAIILNDFQYTVTQ